MSPNLASEIDERRTKKKPISKNNSEIERRIRDIDKQIAKFMELYQVDGIPADILGANINKLYHEKTSLEKLIVVETEPEELLFDLLEKMLADAAQIWDFADLDQKRRIIKMIIKKITLTDDNVDIEWNF